MKLGIICFIGFSLTQALQAKAQESLTLYTENNPPFTFFDTEAGKPAGPAVEIINAIMQQTETTYSVQILPWRRAFRTTLKEPNTCLFLTYRTPEREKLFSWVGPLVTGEWAIFKRNDSDIEITALSDLQNYAVVGMASSADALALQAALGRNILQTASGELAAQMLYRGRADLWISDVFGGVTSAKAMGLPIPKVAFFWKTSDLSLACSAKTSPALIDRLNEANRGLEDFKRDLLAKVSGTPRNDTDNNK